MEVFICAAYNLISASVMHPVSQETGIRATSVFLFFIETWESVGIRVQFCEKYAMFGESLVAVFQAREHA